MYFHSNSCTVYLHFSLKTFRIFDFKFLIKVAVRGVVTQILMIHGCILIHSPNKAEERQKLQAEIELLTTKLRDLDQKMAMASEGAVGV